MTGDTTFRVGLGLFAPLGAKVNALGSSIEARSADGTMERAGAALGGEGAEEGGGGGGAAVGDAWPAARIAACMAKLADMPFVGGGEGAEAGGGGGGGRLDRLEADGGGGGRDEAGGGGGGAGGSAGAELGGGGAGIPGSGGGWIGAVFDGLRETGSGGGFLPTGGGGLPLLKDIIEAEDTGRGASPPAVLRKFAIDGWKVGPPWGGGRGGRSGMAGAPPGGGFGAEKDGIRGAELADSGSDRYDESRFATQVDALADILRLKD